MTHPIESIARFMELGGQIVPGEVDHGYARQELWPFIARVHEEIQETTEALLYKDTAEVVDGFIDIAYVALTGAIRVAGNKKAEEAWDAVVDANLAKVDGRHGDVVRDPETGKILKPEGWTAPDIEGILNN